MTATDSLMPYGQAAARLAPQLPPLPISGGAQAPSAQASPMAQGATPMAAAAAPQQAAQAAPQEPMWQVKLQADGSSVYVIPGMNPDGSDFILGAVNKPPPLPKALQTPKPQAQA